MHNKMEKEAQMQVARGKEIFGDSFKAETHANIAADAKRLERIAFELKDRAETVLFWLERNNFAGLKTTSLERLAKDFDETCLRLRTEHAKL